MEIFSEVLNHFPFRSASSSMDKKDSSSCHSEEEFYLLATSWPKNRECCRVFKETRHPIFRGVRRRNLNKLDCEPREPNKKSRIWLGTYATPEMAATAHDLAALALRGKSTCLNYADSAWRLPLPDSNDAKNVRKAVAEAAETFRPDQDRLEEEDFYHSDHIVEV